MEQYAIRTCGHDCTCARSGHRVAEATNTPGPLKWAGPVEEVVELPPPVRQRPTAIHEAAHGVVAHAVGLPVTGATIDGNPHCDVSYAASSPAQAAVVLLAGNAGELWANRWSSTLSEAELSMWIKALRELRIGPCDVCRALLAVVRLHGSGADDATFIATFRRWETEANALVRRPDIWRAISAIASELLDLGTITGDRAHEIAAAHVARGSIEFGV